MARLIGWLPWSLWVAGCTIHLPYTAPDEPAPRQAAIVEADDPMIRYHPSEVHTVPIDRGTNLTRAVNEALTQLASDGVGYVSDIHVGWDTERDQEPQRCWSYLVPESITRVVERTVTVPQTVTRAGGDGGYRCRLVRVPQTTIVYSGGLGGGRRNDPFGGGGFGGATTRTTYSLSHECRYESVPGGNTMTVLTEQTTRSTYQERTFVEKPFECEPRPPDDPIDHVLTMIIYPDTQPGRWQENLWRHDLNRRALRARGRDALH